jgi:hypothetical protein
MKFDVQIPLTASQFERLKTSQNLKGDLATVLPKAKYAGIRAYLGDPAYLLRVVRPFKGKAAHLLLRMERPIVIFKNSLKLHRLTEKNAAMEGVTVNQYIVSAIQYQLDKLEGKK